jgi:hypothetical protein
MKRFLYWGLSAAFGITLGLMASIPSAFAPPLGKGPMGKGKDASHAEDMAVFHYLLDNREHINRKVKKLDNGVETLTESDKPEIAAKIRNHAEAMDKRIKEGRPIHLRDPLFRAVFENAKKITMTVEKTDKGVQVKEVSDDPYVAKLIQAHAEVVSGFIANGYAEMRKNHVVPDRQ